MKTIPLKTLLERIQLLPWNIIPVNSQFSAPLHETYIIHACNHFPELVEAIRVIADDCEELSRVDVVDKAESRAWKSIESRIRKALASAETVQIEE